MKRLLWIGLLIGCTANRSVRRGDRYLAADRHAAAANAYQAAIESNIKNTRGLHGFANASILTGHPEEAISLTQRAWSSDVPGSDVAHARVLIASGHGAKAANVLSSPNTEALPLDQWWTLRAEAELAAGDLQAAQSATEHSLDSRDPTALALSAWIHLRAAAPERALSLANQLRQSDGAPLLGAAAVFWTLGDHETARQLVADLDTSTDLNPEQLWLEAARRDSAGDRENAIRILTQMRVLEPDNGTLAWRLGALWLDRGLPALAVPALLSALSLPPYEVQERTEELVMVAEFGDTISEDDPTPIWDALVIAYSQLNNISAMAGAQHGLARETTEYEAYHTSALLYLKAEELDQAMVVFQEAAARFTTNPTPHINLAQIWVQKGDLDAALEAARVAWNLQVGNPTIAIALADIHLLRKEPRLAEQIIEQAKMLHPNNEGLRARQ